MEKIVVKLRVPADKIAGERFITPTDVAEKVLADCRFMNYRQLCRALPDVKQASFVRVGIAPEFTRTADFIGLQADTTMFCFAAQMQNYLINRFETDYSQNSLIILYEPFAEFAYILHSGLVELSEPVDFQKQDLMIVRCYNSADTGKKSVAFKVTAKGLEVMDL